MVFYLCLIGWLPDAVLRIHGTAPCVLALLITIPSYTIVVYKVKKQGKKIAKPSRGGAPAKSSATTIAADKNKSGSSPPVAVVSSIGTTPVAGNDY